MDCTHSIVETLKYNAICLSRSTQSIKLKCGHSMPEYTVSDKLHTDKRMSVGGASVLLHAKGFFFF